MTRLSPEVADAMNLIRERRLHFKRRCSTGTTMNRTHYFGSNFWWTPTHSAIDLIKWTRRLIFPEAVCLLPFRRWHNDAPRTIQMDGVDSGGEATSTSQSIHRVMDSIQSSRAFLNRSFRYCRISAEAKQQATFAIVRRANTWPCLTNPNAMHIANIESTFDRAENVLQTKAISNEKLNIVTCSTMHWARAVFSSGKIRFLFAFWTSI